ncbi:MAG: hypothetical protein JST79_17435 [Acidobacteria bacterium]|nr:hypothetical protein [Acidobacteriota bacterium]
MKASGKVTIVAGLLLLGSLAGSVVLLRKIDRMRSHASLEEVLYISSPKALKRLSLGYDGLLADIYWTRAVQYFGATHSQGSEHYELLAPLLEITTTLDPHLLVAYEYGANFMAAKRPNGAGQPEEAAKLVERGIESNPHEWRLYYNLGFIYYMELKDYPKAAAAFSQGSQVSNAHPFLKVLAAQMAQHAGDAEMARMLWTTTYESTQDHMIRANALAHLRALRVDQDITAMEERIEMYQKRTGKLPESFADLIQSGLLPGVPLDPLGHAYKLMDDGRVEVRTPDDLPFIEKGKPLGYVPPKVPKFLPSD